MWLPTAILVLRFLYSFGFQNQFIVKLENASRTYLNDKFVSYTIGLVPFNDSVNLLNCTLCYKYKPGDDIVLDLKSYRVTKSNRVVRVFAITRPFKETLEMDAFNVNTLWRDYTRPLLIWPPTPGVTYRTFGWAPDATYFPPNLPSGKLRADVIIGYKNGTQLYSFWVTCNIIYK